MKNEEIKIKKPIWDGVSNKNKSVIVLMSGGLDSSVLTYKLAMEYPKVLAIGFDYGQKNKNELEAAKKICKDFSIEYRILDATFIEKLSKNNYMFNVGTDIDIKNKNFIVPFRNGFFIEMAAIMAYNENYQYIALGALLEEQVIADKNKTFLLQLQKTINAGIGDNFNIKIITPFIDELITKYRLFRVAKKYGILEYLDKNIVTCYDGAVGILGCKKCGRCKALKFQYDYFLFKEGELNA